MAELPKLLSPGPVPTSTSASGTSVGGSAGKLPKVNRNDVLRATNQTFVQPALNKVTSGFRALNPVNMARQWAYANPVTSKLIDFKANIDDNRSERDRPMREARASRGSADDNAGWRDARRGVWNPINEARGGEGGMGGDVSAVVEAVDRLRDTNISSFTGLISELRAIRSNSITIVRNTNMSFGEQKKTNASLINLAEMIKDLGANRGPSLEDRIEGNRGTATDSEVGNKPENLIKSLIGMLLGGAAAFASKFLAGLAAASLMFRNGFGAITSGINRMFATARLGVLVLAQELRVGLAAFGSRITSILKGIQLPKSLLSIGTRIGAFFGLIDGFAKNLRVPTGLAKVGGGISATVGKLVDALSGVGKALAPMGRLGGVVAKLGGFLKFIPVVGQFILVATAIFDGIKGFISGWSNTDGTFMERAWGGLKGAVAGIVKGFIAPFKWLGEVLWKGIRGIGEALGLGKFIKQLESIDFGALFGKVVSAFNPGNVVGKVADWFFDFIKGLANKFLGIAAPAAIAAIEIAEGAGRAVQNAAASAPGAIGAAANWAGRTWDNMTGGGGGGGSSTPSSDKDGKPIAFSRDVPIEGRALLDAIAGTESPGYNVMYGGRRFNTEDGHPNVAVRIGQGPNKGKTSSAAGRYQFLHGTWLENAENPNDFSPEAQDRAAWKLARDTYRSATNRNLGDDLKDPARAGEIGRILRGKWTSLPGGIEQAGGNNVDRFQRRFDEAMAQQRAAEQANAQRVRSTPAPARPTTAAPVAAWRPPTASRSLEQDAAARLRSAPAIPTWANGQVRNQADSLNAAERDRNKYARSMVFQPPSNNTTVVAPVTNNVRQTNVRTSGGGYRYDRGPLDSSSRF